MQRASILRASPIYKDMTIQSAKPIGDEFDFADSSIILAFEMERDSEYYTGQFEGFRRPVDSRALDYVE